MPLARCPKCGRTFPNTLHECPGCGYSPFVRPEAPVRPPLSPKLEPMPEPDLEGMPQGYSPAPPLPYPQQAAKADAPAEDEDEHVPIYRRVYFWIIAAVLLLGIAAAVIFLLPRLRGGADEPDAHKHVWAEATCTEPKTCTVCGETEGEPLGHDFVDGICTVCGAYENPFAVSDLNYSRNGDHFIFTGKVTNHAGADVKNIRIKLEFFDNDHKLVQTDWTYAAEHEPLPADATLEWTYVYAEPYLTARFFRATVTDFAFETE